MPQRVGALRALCRIDGSTESLLDAALDVLPARDGQLFGAATRYHFDEDGLGIDALVARDTTLDRLATAFAAAATSPPPLFIHDYDLTSITCRHSSMPTPC